jgi:hypothetical protein
MKVKITFTFSSVINIPDVLTEKTEGGIPTVVNEITEQMKLAMGLKYGKEVDVKVEVVDG